MCLFAAQGKGRWEFARLARCSPMDWFCSGEDEKMLSKEK